jgi:hypothetical protein
MDLQNLMNASKMVSEGNNYLNFIMEYFDIDSLVACDYDSLYYQIASKIMKIMNILLGFKQS